MRFRVDPERPHRRRIEQTAEALQQGRFAVVPTEATYAFVVLPGKTGAIEAIRRIRRLDEKHLWSLFCPDLRTAARYAHLDDVAFRLIRRHTPGPYTWILPASSALPRRVFGKRKEVGVRISASPVIEGLLAALEEPVMLATTVQFPEEEMPETDPERIWLRIHAEDCVMLDGGWGAPVPTTIIDLTEGEPVLVREGMGAWPQ